MCKKIGKKLPDTSYKVNEYSLLLKLMDHIWSMTLRGVDLMCVCVSITAEWRKPGTQNFTCISLWTSPTFLVKNYVPDILHLAYFQILFKKAKIEYLINYYQMKRIRNMNLTNIFCCSKIIGLTHLVHNSINK